MQQQASNTHATEEKGRRKNHVNPMSDLGWIYVHAHTMGSTDRETDRQTAADGQVSFFFSFLFKLVGP